MLQTINHDGSIIVSSLSMPLRVLGEVEKLLQHTCRPMKLARIDPFACAAKHETTAARQPRNTAQPIRRLRPHHLGPGAYPGIWPAAQSGGFHVSINCGYAHRDRYEAASHIISPVAILLAARHLLRSQPSTRITGIIHQLSRTAMCRKAVLGRGRFGL